MPSSRSFASARPRLRASSVLVTLFALFASLSCFAPLRAHAEGSANTLTDGGYRPFLEYREDFQFETTLLRRTIVRVYVEPGDTLLLASSANGLGDGRIEWRAPDGSSGVGPLVGVGNIPDRDAEVAGPLPNPGGYAPIAIPVPSGAGGVWEIHFHAPKIGGIVDPPPTPVGDSWIQPADVNYVCAWDVTVRRAGGGTVPGRAYLNQFAFNMGGFDADLRSAFHLLTRDGFEYQFETNGLEVFPMNLFANSRGVTDVNGVPLHRSGLLPDTRVHDPDAPDTPLDATHKLFFAEPAADLPADAPTPGGTTWLRRPIAADPAITDLAFTGIEGTPGQAGSGLGGEFRFVTATPTPYRLELDLDGSGTFGDPADRVFEGQAVAGTNRVLWDGNDGLGQPARSQNSPAGFAARLLAYRGEVHVPYLDVENNAGGIVLRRLNGPGAPDATIFYDDRTVGGVAALPPAGENSGAGGHRWAGRFGDKKAIDTWCLVPASPISFPPVRVRQADLEIVSKTHSPDPFVRGQAATWTVLARNNGPDTAYVATLRDSLPADFTAAQIASVELAGGAVNRSAQVTNGTLVSTLDLPPASTATFHLSGVIAADAAGPLVNRAAILRPNDNGDLDDQNRRGDGNNSKSDTARVVDAGVIDLAIDKTHVGTFTVGQNAIYRILVRNVSSLPSVGAITVLDTLPAGLTYVSGTGNGWTIGANGPIVTATTPNVIAPGDSSVFTLSVAVGSAAAPRVTNAATVSGGGDSNPKNNRDTDTASVCSTNKPDLTVGLTALDQPCVGEALRYRVVVRNVGGRSTSGTITARDTLPAGLTFTSATGTGWTIGANGSLVTATTPGPLAAGDSLVFVLATAVGEAARPSVTNSITVSGGGDASSANNRTSTTVAICAGPQPDLAISLAGLDQPCVGEPLRYRILVRNVGAAPTVGTITVLDTLPAGLTFTSATGTGWTIGANGSLVTATSPGPLASGDSLVFVLTTAVGEAARPSVTNSATVVGGGDATPVNNSTSTTVAICAGPQPDLAISLAGLDQPCVGEPLRYRVLVRNVGAAPTVGTITVLDTLPAGLTFTSATGNGWTIGANGSLITATSPGPLASGDSLVFVLTTAVGEAARPSVTNSATVVGGGDASSANNRTSTTVAICAGPQPDLAISLAGLDQPCVGEPLRYRILVRNVGAAPTVGTITVLDTLPAGLTFTSATGTGWTIGANGSLVTATTPGPLAADDSLVFVLTTAVGEAARPSVTNRVTVSGGGDASSANNRTSTTVAICAGPEPDLAISLAGLDQPCVGEPLRYRILVRNVGAAPTVGTITVLDTLPAGLTFTSATGTGWTIGANGSLVTATTPGPLASGDSLAFVLTTAVGEAARPSVTNSITVSGGGDASSANNRTSTTVAICAGPEPDLAISLAGLDQPCVGEPLRYRVLVRNVGAAPTVGTITVLDTLPAGLTFTSATGTGWTIGANGSLVTATTPGPLAAGDSLVFVLTTAVGEAARPSVTNSVTVSGGGDASSANNRTSTTVAICAGPEPDLAIDKSHVGTFTVGENASYRIVVRNVSNVSSVGTITVLDTLPPGLTFVSGSGTGWTIGANGQFVTATTPNVIAAGDSSAFTLRVAVGAAAEPQVINAATVSGGGDTNPLNNRDTDTAPVAHGGSPDLAISLAGLDQPCVGEPLRYRILVRNVGAAPTVGTITVLDTLPAGLTFTSATGTGWTIGANGSLVTATTPGPLASGDSLVFVLTTAVGEAARPSVTNSATVVGGGDATPVNNSTRATVQICAGPQPDLAIDKRHVGSFTVGENASYRIVVRNVSIVSSVGTITVLDTLPAGLTYVSGTGTGWTIGANGQLVTATTPNVIAAGDSSAFTLTVAVGAAAEPQVTNAATVSGGGDTNPLNNRDTDTAPVAHGGSPDLAIEKTHVGQFVTGANAAYRLVVRNVGPVATTGPTTVRDTLPAGLSFASADGAGWSTVVNPPFVVLLHPGLLQPGDSTVITLTVHVLPEAPAEIVNYASVSTPGDTNPTNDRDGDRTSSASPGRLVLEKFADPTDVTIGDLVNYTITVRNVGGVLLRAVEVTDLLPAGLRYVPGTALVDGRSVPDPAGFRTRSLIFTVGDIAAQQTRRLQYRVEVGAGAELGTGTNIALATSPGDSTTNPVTPPVQSNPAYATIRIRPGVFTDEGIIAGKVFADCDCDSNGVQGAEELGVPGVRLYLEDGTSAVTDAEGKYSFDHVRPRLHVLRVDPSTLPPGVLLRTLDTREAFDPNSRFVDLTRGEFHRADFATRPPAPAALAEIKLRRRVGELNGPLVEGVRPDAPGEPRPASASPLGLAVPERSVPADGTSEVRVRLARASGTASSRVTLESTLGQWLVADEDPAAPGTQYTLPAGETIVSLRAPLSDGTARLRVTDGDAQDSAVVRFTPALRSLLLTGLVEGRLDWRNRRDRDLCTACRDRFEDDLRDASFHQDDGRFSGGSRAALFGKGVVGRDVLVTLRYDSERDPFARRFRDLRPLEGYDVFGDASVHEYDARSTSRLYARVDRAASYAMFGDFLTPASELRQLGAFNRSLNGGLAHLENRYVQLSGFGTQARERQVVDEFPGQGVSGPFTLSRADGVLGTEVVELLVRDRNQPSVVIRREPQTRFVDYTLEPFTGRLLFRHAVPSVDPELNPVSIRVLYEVEASGSRYGVYGGDVDVTPARSLTLGASAARDEDPLAPRSLASAHARFSPWSSLALTAEAARSDSGGALFDGTTHANAWRGDARLQLGRSAARFYAQRTEPGFANPSSGILAGRAEYGADARTALAATSLFGRALRSEDLVTRGRRDGAEAGIGQRVGPFGGELAYRWAQETREPATSPTAPVRPNDVSTLRGRLSADLPVRRPSTAFGEYERNLVRDGADRWALGADTRLAARTRLYARHENIASFAGPFALNDAQQQASTVIGLASDELRDATVFGEYRARDAFAGRETQAAIGLRERWLVRPGLRLDALAEHVEVIHGGSGDATSLAGGFEYTGSPLWKSTGRLEFRTQAGLERWLSSAGVAHKLSRDWTTLARTTWYWTPDEERTDGRTQLGLAWRQTERNAWNALGRYENHLDRLGRGTDPYRRLEHVAAADLNWHPARRLTMSGQTAARWTIDDRAGLTVRTDAELFGARARLDLTDRLDVGLVGRRLSSDHFRQWQGGLGAELGVVVARNLRLAGGWNVFGFRDAGLSGSDCTDRGPYVRLGLKFDEGLFGRASARPGDGDPRPIAVAEAIASPARTPDPLPTTVAPLASRTTDERIAHDLAVMDAWGARLDALPGAANDPWRRTAARRWLDVARTEYTDNDETGFAEAALANGVSLVEAIARGESPVTRENVPAAQVLPGSTKLREQLWNDLDVMKHREGFACAAEDLARLEVELAWAGNERRDQGDCVTDPHVQEAERLARRAAAEEDSCATTPKAPVQPPVVPPGDELPPRGIAVPRNVHFAFDECVIGPESRKALEEIAALMRRYPTLKIRLEGHTDVRGTDAYNLGLSDCRVCSVRGVLQELGILDSRITGIGRGKQAPAEPDRNVLAHARNRRVELVLTDREGREIETTPQEQDLQIERWKPTGKRVRRHAAAEFPPDRVLICKP